MILKFEPKIMELLYGLAQNTLDFIDDRKHRWTPELSNHGVLKLPNGPLKSTLTNKKRNMTRNIFYSQAGAGSSLDGVFLKQFGFYTSSIIGQSKDCITGDHINPPQELGEFFLDRLMGYHTEKDESILNIDIIVDCLVFCMKKVQITKSLNTKLSKYTPSKKYGGGIVTTEKYSVLNENHDEFKGQLTILQNNKDISSEQMEMLFSDCPIDGYKEWQIKKWGAETYGVHYGKASVRKYSQDLFSLCA
jgi:hypothetical protein